MPPTWALGVAFAEPTKISVDALFSNNGIINWLAKDTSKPGRPSNFETWVIHFSSPWSANNLDVSEELLTHQAMSALQKISKSPLPKVHALFKHRWLYARSSAQNAPVTQWDAELNIGLAGDWTQGGRVEDAWCSAQSLAEQILGDS